MTQSQSHVENITVFYCCGAQTINIIYALPTVTQTLMLRFPESFIFKSDCCCELSISVNAKNNFLCTFYAVLYSFAKRELKPPSLPQLWRWRRRIGLDT